MFYLALTFGLEDDPVRRGRADGRLRRGDRAASHGVERPDPDDGRDDRRSERCGRSATRARATRARSTSAREWTRSGRCIQTPSCRALRRDAGRRLRAARRSRRRLERGTRIQLRRGPGTGRAEAVHSAARLTPVPTACKRPASAALPAARTSASDWRCSLQGRTGRRANEPQRPITRVNSLSLQAVHASGKLTQLGQAGRSPVPRPSGPWTLATYSRRPFSSNCPTWRAQHGSPPSSERSGRSP